MFTDKIYAKWMAETQHKKIKEILRNIKISPDARILDIGCGPGFLEEILQNKNIIAVDTNAEYLENIKTEKILASGDALNFKNEFDLVFCIDTIHLLKNPKKLADYLKSGGKLVISIFCNENNSGEKLDFLKNIFSQLKLEKSFIIKTEKELDAVCVFKN